LSRARSTPVGYGASSRWISTSAPSASIERKTACSARPPTGGGGAGVGLGPLPPAASRRVESQGVCRSGPVGQRAVCHCWLAQQCRANIGPGRPHAKPHASRCPGHAKTKQKSVARRRQLLPALTLAAQDRPTPCGRTPIALEFRAKDRFGGRERSEAKPIACPPPPEQVPTALTQVTGAGPARRPGRVAGAFAPCLPF
jgi:hypothetical protein